MQCSAVQCSAVQYSALQCSAVHYSALHCTALHCSALQQSLVPWLIAVGTSVAWLSRGMLQGLYICVVSVEGLHILEEKCRYCKRSVDTLEGLLIL